MEINLSNYNHTHMKRMTLFFAVLVSLTVTINAQEKLDDLLPVRGLCISAPQKDGLDEFIKFIKEELVPKNVNTLVLRVDWNYAYKSHPELRDEDPLTTEDVKKIVSEIVESSGATDIKDIGKIMGPAMAKLKGKADGKLVQQIARSLLSS